MSATAANGDESPAGKGRAACSPLPQLRRRYSRERQALRSLCWR